MKPEDILNLLRQQVEQNGYFVNGYARPIPIGAIVPVSCYMEWGNSKIVAETTVDEFRKLFGRDPTKNGRYFYRQVIE